MQVLTPQAIAALTIMSGFLFTAIGLVLMFFNRPCKSNKQGMLTLLGYAFTASPIAFLVWNCLALTLKEWDTTAFVDLVAFAETNSSESNGAVDASNPTLGVGAPLLAYAGISVLFHITSDLFASVKEHFVKNPES